MHLTHHLADRTGCGYNDPDHSYKGGRVQFNGGKCDGFRKDPNDDFAIGYYLEKDLPLYGPLSKVSTVYDRYFCSILGPTYPNRFYTHAAATDRISNTMDLSDLATIWDRLNDKGVSANYYFSDLPFIGLFGPRLLPNARAHRTVLRRRAGGQPAVVLLPRPVLPRRGPRHVERRPPSRGHPARPAFVSRVISAVVNSPQWERTALVITYDEWAASSTMSGRLGCPTTTTPGPDGKDDHAQAGFRVPTMVLSPFARRGQVAHHVYDHTSILKMVEWRFGLKPLTKRDRFARNLAGPSTSATPARRSPTSQSCWTPVRRCVA